jgi:glucose dehydrogenase
MRIRIVALGALIAGTLPSTAHCQTDWPNFSHDAGGTRYSPLKEINAKTVSKLKLVWTFDTTASVTEVPRVEGGSPKPVPSEDAGKAGGAPGAPAGQPLPGGSPPPHIRIRQSKSVPLVIGNTMYFSTPFNRVLALNAETGAKMWEYVLPFSPASRGISYWPGEGEDAPEIFVGTNNGRLIALNATTGKPVAGFGENGILNARIGVADEFPNNHYGISSPPAIYKDLVIIGCQLQEMPSKGPYGDVRAWDVRTGKLVWAFHTMPRPGEAHHEVWQENEWQGRTGLNAWGIMTVDVKNGIVFLPLGTPSPDFYGGDRKGSNLYGSSLVAVDAETGKLKWFFQTTHHDNWDYDDCAAPVMITVKRNGKETLAVAQVTKQGLLFILDRFSGKPIYDVEERPVALDNIPPGDDPSATQPFPVRPPPLTRNSFSPDQLAKLTPKHDKACKDLLSLEGGVMTGGPYPEYGPKLRVIFPGWTGGSNWWGMAYDPNLGYLFVNTKSDGMLNKLVPDKGEGYFGSNTTYSRVGPDNPPPGGGGSFKIGPWPCEAPPWGEFMAVDVNTGNIAWRVPLGSFPELDALGIPTTGRMNSGGATATAGGLVFIAATEDHKFRAFDSRTGKILWETALNSTGFSIPISYRGSNGKQYIAIISTGSDGEDRAPPLLYVYSLP